MSLQLDRALDKVREGVSSLTPTLPPGDYVVYGGAFRSFLEGRQPADYDIALQGSGLPEPTEAARLFGAPSASTIRSFQNVREVQDAGWSYSGSVHGLDIFLARSPNPFAYSGQLPASVVSFFATNYKGTVIHPLVVPTIVGYMDFRVCRAAMLFSVSSEGAYTFGSVHIPPGFEEAVATRMLHWDTEMVCFRRERINRVARYLQNYGYQIPDHATLNKMKLMLRPPEEVVNQWLLYNPHLR